MTAFMLFLASAAVSAICVILVFHRDYEDGLVGRVALAMIALASAVRAMGIIESGFELRLNPIATLLWLGLALFFSRHLYRFLRWHNCGEHGWREADKTVTAGKG